MKTSSITIGLLLLFPATAASFTVASAEETVPVLEISETPGSVLETPEAQEMTGPPTKPEPASGASTLSLIDLIREAFEKNPGIQAARSRWKAAIERYPQAVALADPMVSYEYSLEEPVEIRIQQEFPYPGKRQLQGDIVQKEVEMARLEYEIALRDVIVELKVAYFEFRYLESAKALTEEVIQELSNALRLANARYALDKTGLSEILSAQNQIARLQYDATALQNLGLSAKTRINTLLDWPTEGDLPSLLPLSFKELRMPLEQLYLSAVERRQELGLARLGIDRAQKSLELAQKMSKPDFTGELIYMRGEKDDPGFMLGIRVPFWGPKNRARVLEAHYNKDALAFSLRNQENATRSEIKKIYIQLENTRRLIELHRDQLIPKTKQSLDIAWTWYQEGQGSFSEILEGLSSLLNLNLAHARAVSEYQQDLARLEQMVGSALPHPANNGKPDSKAANEGLNQEASRPEGDDPGGGPNRGPGRPAPGP